MGIEVYSASLQQIEYGHEVTITNPDSIPLIDLSPLLNSHISDAVGDSLVSLVSEVEAACKEWGFFRVINHGIPSEFLDRLLSAAKEFFALSAKEKGQVRRDQVIPVGYYDSEYTKNIRDWKEVFDFVLNEHQLPASPNSNCSELQTVKNQWPENPSHLREAFEEYVREVEKLSFKLLELISLSLKLPPKRLNGFFKDQTSNIRINHYPPCPTPDLGFGIGPHQDTGVLTVLAQDNVGGLEVWRKSDGQWIGVKPIPNSYIINVGSIMQVWSNDMYESPVHRVTVNSKERFSIPFFLKPAHYTMVAPLGGSRCPLYREYNWGKYIRSSGKIT